MSGAVRVEAIVERTYRACTAERYGCPQRVMVHAMLRQEARPQVRVHAHVFVGTGRQGEAAADALRARLAAGRRVVAVGQYVMQLTGDGLDVVLKECQSIAPAQEVEGLPA